jgi:hypothetical protein
MPVDCRSNCHKTTPAKAKVVKLGRGKKKGMASGVQMKGAGA